ncbi:DnaJ-domain-containing protein, partial [Auriculariales sp. MPI-PUGE-AT-0066]
DGDVNLYAVLGLQNADSTEDIRKAYRKLALLHHPDKHSRSSSDKQQVAAQKFQQVGFAYASYFAELFDNVTRAKLDEMKKEYQGSEEEREDVIAAFRDSNGDFEDIMTRIPHSTFADESRLIVIINTAVSAGELKANAKWKSSSADKKAKARRKKEAEGEAAEAEEMAKEMGVWDEFYGSGKMGKRKARGATSANATAQDDEGDVSGLQALIQQRQKARMGSLVDSLAEKYGALDEDPGPVTKGKKRKAAAAPNSRNKRAKVASAEPDIDDAEFERIQQEMLAGGTRR